MRARGDQPEPGILLADLDHAHIHTHQDEDEDTSGADPDDPLPESSDEYRILPQAQPPMGIGVTTTAWEKIDRLRRDDPLKVFKAAQYFTVERLYKVNPRFTLQQCHNALMRTGRESGAQALLTNAIVENYRPWMKRKREFAKRREQWDNAIENTGHLFGEDPDTLQLSSVDEAGSSSTDIATSSGFDPRIDERADILLLQSVLSSSRFSRLRNRVRLPISGHWAVEIRDEVFELNRLESYVRTLTFSTGSRAEVGSMSREEYGNRGEWSITTRKIGSTHLSQEFIRYHLERRKDYAMFYSLLSHNCQHFIVDFLDYLKVDFETEVLEGLWTASRITYLLGSLLQILLAVAIVYTFTLSNPLFILCLATIYAIVLASHLGYSNQTAGRTVSGVKYNSGSCYTGPYTKSILLSNPSRPRRLLLWALLYLERISYLNYLTVSLFVFGIVGTTAFEIQKARKPGAQVSFEIMFMNISLVALVCSVPFMTAWLLKPGNCIIKKSLTAVPQATLELEAFLEEIGDEYDSVP